LVPGVLNNDISAETESFSEHLLEYPQYTRPEVFMDKEVPEVLLSGHHGKIAQWRREQSILRTAKNRPDLLKKATLTEMEQQKIRSIMTENQTSK
jgi:tRNA (guanine37-N1)-methyltransferase